MSCTKAVAVGTALPCFIFTMIGQAEYIDWYKPVIIFGCIWLTLVVIAAIAEFEGLV